MGIIDTIWRAVFCSDDDFYNDGYEDGVTLAEEQPNLGIPGLAGELSESYLHNAEVGYTESQNMHYQAGLTDGYGEAAGWTSETGEYSHCPPSEFGTESFLSRVKRALW